MMPPLPPPTERRTVGVDGQLEILRWDEAKLLAYGRAVAEACAAECEAARVNVILHSEYNEACDDCAAAIRRMATDGSG